MTVFDKFWHKLKENAGWVYAGIFMTWGGWAIHHNGDSPWWWFYYATLSALFLFLFQCPVSPTYRGNVNYPGNDPDPHPDTVPVLLSKGSVEPVETPGETHAWTPHPVDCPTCQRVEERIAQLKNKRDYLW